MSEKDCYQKNINSACGLLREEKEFTDVTLASEDGHQIEANRVCLLQVCSSRTCSVGKKHPHPLIYMR